MAQGIEHELHHPRVARVEGVAAAGAVEIAAPVGGVELVVAGVVDAAERQGRAGVVALGGVVVDDVEPGLDPGGVQLPDRRLQAAEAALPEVARIRGEVAEGLIAPEVDEALLDQEAVIREGLDRQQLQGRDAELDEVLDDRRMGERRVGAALGLGDVGMGAGQRLDVRLVHHRLGEGPAHGREREVGHLRGGDHAFRHVDRAVAPVDRSSRGPGGGRRARRASGSGRGSPGRRGRAPASRR